MLNYNTLCFEDRFVFCVQASTKQISLHGDYLQCNALWLTSDGYSNQDVSHALYARNKQWNKTEEPAGIAMLPYQRAASNKISRLLAECDMKTHYLPVKKNHSRKNMPANPLCMLYTMWMWKGACQRSRHLETRCKEHVKHLFVGSQRIRL